MEVITEMNKDELQQMSKDLNINKWGHMLKMQKALELLKKKYTSEAKNMKENMTNHVLNMVV